MPAFLAGGIREPLRFPVPQLTVSPTPRAKDTPAPLLKIIRRSLRPNRSRLHQRVEEILPDRPAGWQAQSLTRRLRAADFCSLPRAALGLEDDGPAAATHVDDLSLAGCIPCRSDRILACARSGQHFVKGWFRTEFCQQRIGQQIRVRAIILLDCALQKMERGLFSPQYANSAPW